MNITPVLYAGPSLLGIHRSTFSGVKLLPPVRRGDVEQLVDEASTPGILIIADGIFHQYPSVGHAELRRAIRLGWQVWGVASMGAIRAAEMRNFGMHGFGEVFERFATDPNFTDDEVALLHLGDSPYTPVTEPLIHIRRFLAELLQQNLVRRTECSQILERLSTQWYGHRTLRLLEQLMLSNSGLDPADLKYELQTFQRYRVKNADLESLLKARPWAKS
jgi:hypothetical protein